MIFSDQLVAVLRQAIILAAAQEQDVADLPHVVAALTQPLPDEPVIQGGMSVFSPAVDRVVKRAKRHARAQGSEVTGRRDLAAALRHLGDTQPGSTALLSTSGQTRARVSASAVTASLLSAYACAAFQDRLVQSISRRDAAPA